MTGGVAVILGSIGANFGAGMTGGMAYLHDPEGRAGIFLNMSTLEVVPLTSPHWEEQCRLLIERHAAETHSAKAGRILDNWETERRNFLQVCPTEMVSRLPHPLGETREVKSA